MIKTLIEVLLSAVVLAAAEVTDTPIPPTTKYEYPPVGKFFYIDLDHTKKGTNVHNDIFLMKFNLTDVNGNNKTFDLIPTGNE